MSELGSPLVNDLIRSTPRVITGTGTAVNDTPIPSTEVLGRWVSVQFTGNPTLTVNFEHSNDGSTWAAFPLSNAALAGPVTPTTSTTSLNNSVYHGPCSARYFRVKVSAATSGTVTATAVISAFPGAFPFLAQTPSDGATASGLPASALHVMNAGSGAWDRIRSTVADGAAATGILSNTPSQYNGATFDRVRTPNTFKTATATASGDTALWTPTSGKKFRLMRYQIQVTADAAQTTGGDIDVVLRDATTGLAASYSVFVPGLAGSSFGNTSASGWIDLGNGILSAAANNVLNINLSAALTSGKVRAVVAGTEE